LGVSQEAEDFGGFVAEPADASEITMMFGYRHNHKSSASSAVLILKVFAVCDAFLGTDISFLIRVYSR
jgi:hypothetical protein